MDIGLASAPGKSDGMAQGLGTGAVQSTCQHALKNWMCTIWPEILQKKPSGKSQLPAAERTESVLWLSPQSVRFHLNPAWLQHWPDNRIEWGPLWLCCPKVSINLFQSPLLCANSITGSPVHTRLGHPCYYTAASLQPFRPGHFIGHQDPFN